MPGSIACVVYTQGCNRNCHYCHNKECILQKPGIIKWQYIINFLISRKSMIEAVVFTGGEPTLQSDLTQKIKECKHLNYKIGLHTNGDGDQFNKVTHLCNYILLSHYNDEKIKIALKAQNVSLSRVVWNSELKKYENKIKVIKSTTPELKTQGLEGKPSSPVY